MVVFLLKVKAELENVTNLRLPANYSFCFDLGHPQSDEVREKVVISPEEKVEVPGSKGEVNLSISWPESKRQGHITILDNYKGKDAPRPITEEDSDYVTLAAFECRGCEPVKWHQLGELVCESTEGKTFDEVDLTEDDWCDYDDENDLSVGISDLAHEFHRG